MNEQEQRIAIAEACGWRIVRTDGVVPLHQVFEPSGKACCDYATGGDSWRGYGDSWRGYLPDYLHDLNAMHEAEKTLKGIGQFTVYNDAIYTVMQEGKTPNEIEDWPFHAAASQRAEAFLRTIGKWKA